MNCMGFGFILRDVHGVVHECCAWSTQGLSDPAVAEALCIREALSWLKDGGRHHVIVETDSQVVATAICNKVSIPNSLGLVLDDCISLVNHLNNVSVTFIHRSANSVAHSLSRASGS